jgi:serine phosphatase RsbU (regulator of sigma subunit)
MLELSSIHNKLGNYNSSQNCLNNANWFIRSKNISSLRGEVLLAQSELYLLMGKVEEALANCEKSIEIFKTIENARLFASMSLLGEIYTQLNRYNQGEDILKKTIAEQKEINDQSGQAITYLRLANLYGVSKNFTSAIKHYNYSIEHSTNVGLTDIVRQAYKGLWQVYGIMGNIKNAYENLYQYTRITDSLFNVQKISEAISIEENAIRQQHLLELQQKESELVKTKEQVTQQKKNQFLLFITIGLFSLVIVFIYREFKQNKRANELLTYQKKEIEKQKSIAIQKTRNFTDSLNYAQRIQQAILRSSLRIHNLFDEAFIINYPKDIVSGDFYWLSEKNERILFALADCTGHGVPGSLMSIIGTYGLNRIVNELNITSPSEILNQINILFDESLKQKEGVEIFDGMDIALCSYNPKSKELKYSGANIPLHVCRSNLLPQPSNAIIAKGKSSSIFSVKPTKQAIGSFFETKSFTNHSITLMEGDIIYLFTDGYIDQFGGPEGRKYKSAQLYKFLLGISSLQLEEQKKMLEDNFTTWKGKLNQIDDVSFLGIKI